MNIETFPGRLELPLTGTNFHGSKHIRATEVLLYLYVELSGQSFELKVGILMSITALLRL